MPKIRRALISVSDKTGLLELATALRRHGVEILSTGGTAKSLAAAGIPVVQVSDYTGQPEILEGRVKTLVPRIHGGILARRRSASHKREMKTHDILPIDLVAVNLYPFESAAFRRGATFEQAIENIDPHVIDGPDHRAQHREALVERQQAPLVGVVADRHDELVEEAGPAPQDVEVPVGHRVEGPCVDRHAAP